LSFEKNQQFLLNFGALSFKIFPARQFPAIILNISSKNTENALMYGFGKKSKGVSRIKINVVYLVLSLVVKTVFGILSAPLVYLKSIK
jgi:hypothetical protein